MWFTLEGVGTIYDPAPNFDPDSDGVHMSGAAEPLVSRHMHDVACRTSSEALAIVAEVCVLPVKVSPGQKSQASASGPTTPLKLGLWALALLFPTP